MARWLIYKYGEDWQIDSVTLPQTPGIFFLSPHVGKAEEVIFLCYVLKI